MMISDDMRRSGEGFARWLTDKPEKIAEIAPLSTHLKIRAIEVSPPDGYVHLEYEAPKLYANFLGIVHGGLVATFLDDASGIAASLLVGRGLRGTATSSITYLGAVGFGKVEVKAKVLKTTGSLIFAEATLTCQGQPCARSNSVMTYGGLRTLNPVPRAGEPPEK